MRDIAQRWLDWRALGPLASRYRAVSAHAVRADTRKLYTFDAFETAIDDVDNGVKPFASRRRAFLLAENQR